MTLSAGPSMLMLKPTTPRYPTENDILELFNLLKEVQRGFVPNQPFRGYASMTDAEKKRQKAQLSAFEGAEKELKTEQGIISNDFSRKYAEIIGNPPSNKAELDAYVNELQEIVRNFMNEYSKAKYSEQGEYRPKEQQELRRIAKSHNKLIEALTKEYRFGRGKAHGGIKTDTNFGKLMAEAEAKNPRKKNCHYNTRGFLISCSGKAHGKTGGRKLGKQIHDNLLHIQRNAGKTGGVAGLEFIPKLKPRKKGGQAGFSLDKTREIVDQWPGFPYHVPPASKTGPMLNNPRSRVNNRTEANGRPKKSSPKEGGRFGRLFTAAKPRPRPPPRINQKISVNPVIVEPPKEAAGKKKAKKSGKPKYDVI